MVWSKELDLESCLVSFVINLSIESQFQSNLPNEKLFSYQ